MGTSSIISLKDSLAYCQFTVIKISSSNTKIVFWAETAKIISSNKKDSNYLPIESSFKYFVMTLEKGNE